MSNETRLEAFENMLQTVQTQYTDIVSKMAELKNAGKEKSATYRQLMGNKLQLQYVLSLYQAHGLIQSFPHIP